MIERVASSELVRGPDPPLDQWKRLRADGWDVTALVAPDKRSVVFLAALSCERVNGPDATGYRLPT
jgi:hypothetical protein